MVQIHREKILVAFGVKYPDLDLNELDREMDVSWRGGEITTNAAIVVTQMMKQKRN